MSRRAWILLRHFWLGLHNPRLQWHMFHSHDEEGWCQ